MRGPPSRAVWAWAPPVLRDYEPMGAPRGPIVIDNRAYVVEEALEDGRLVLRPDTSIGALRDRLGTEPMSAEQFEQTFGDLPTDAEG